MLPNSGWGRLQTAWRDEPGHLQLITGAWPDSEPPELADPVVPALAEVVVLVASLEAAIPSMKARYPAYGSLKGDSRYALSMATLVGSDELEMLLSSHQPRVLVIDVESCERLGSAALRRMRRRHARVDWLLSWDDPAPKWMPVLIESQAKGFLRPGGAAEFEQALEAVVRGDVWFPRSVSQWLYQWLLERAHAGNPVDRRLACEPELTARESEVMALMRHGLTNKQIGLRMGISVNTVKKHIAHAFEKRGLHSRRQSMT